jgi:serine protease Do
VVPDLIAHGKVTRGWLGVYLGEVPNEMAEELGVPVSSVIFETIVRGSPAAIAGLQAGDILVRFDGKEVDDIDDFRFQVASSVNRNVELEVIRDGRQMTVPVTVGDRSEAERAVQSPRQIPYSENNWLGMSVTECTADIAYRLGVECPESGGVIVVEVMPGSPAYNRNIVPGVIIVEIDKYDIKNIHDYRDAVVKLKDRKKSISFIIYDTEGNTRWVGIRPNR